VKKDKCRLSAYMTCGCLVFLFFFFFLAFVPGKTWAGGLYIIEYNTPSMGVAGAGAEAVAADASTAWHNAAGMTMVEGRELMVGAGLIYSTVKFDPDPSTPVPGGDGGDAGDAAPLLSAFYVHSLSEKWTLGISLGSLSGAAIDYNDDWAGRFLVQEVELISVSAMPAIAYRVNDWLSVGGGVLVTYGKLDMTIAALPPPAPGNGQVEIEDADDVAVAFQLGTLFRLSERARLGIMYRSEIEMELGGDVKINPVGIQAGIDTTLPLAQTVRAGVYFDLSEKVALLSTVAWEDWSSLENQFISTQRGSANIPRNWDDTWHVSGGIHYRLFPDWLLQAGIAYDSSPVDPEDRTPDLPIDRQWRFSLGAQHDFSERFSAGGQFVYADYGDAEINNNLLVGDYKRNDLFFFACNLNWRFD
jgi:long-chain fatty acid transport protein